MFERFTDRARRVVVLAQEESRRLNHNYIGTEHLLLGLVAEDKGVACLVLRDLGVRLEAVRKEVEDAIGRGTRAPTGHIPFTPRAKKVLELALREALQLGHNYIGTEHILLGILREGKGVGCQVLMSLGADLVGVREEIIKVLSASGFVAGERVARGGGIEAAAPSAFAVGMSNAFGLAERIATSRGDQAISRADLLWGLLASKDPAIEGVVRDLGGDPSLIADRIRGLLEGSSPESAPGTSYEELPEGDAGEAGERG